MNPPLSLRMRLAYKAVVGLMSDKSATEAFGLLSGLYPSASGPLYTRGTREILEGYGKMPWLRAVTQKIGETVAATQWQLLAPTSPAAEKHVRVLKAIRDPWTRRKAISDLQDGGDMRVIDNHPLLDALYDPNEQLVGRSLMLLTQIYLDMVGEAFWIKERNGLGVPVGFWPIPPHWIRMTPTPSRRTYWAQWAAWQGEIPDTEVVWFKHADPANPYGRGIGIARTLADELETDEYAARFTRMTFLNQARPDFIVSPEETKTAAGEMSRETALRMQEEWASRHQGFWRAAMPFFATRKLNVTPIKSDSMRELQMTELRKNERDIILQTYGMPPEEMGITESSNRATATVSDFIFKKNLIVPRLEVIVAHVQERLLPEYDDRGLLVFSYENPVEEDKQVQQEMAKANPSSLMVDDWRQLQGFEPLDDGKGQVFLVDSKLVPMTDLTAPMPTPAAPPGGLPPAPLLLPKAGAPLARHVAACRDAKDAGTLALILKADADDADDLPELSRRIARQEGPFRRAVAVRLAALRDAVTLSALEEACRKNGRDSAFSAIAAALPVDTWRKELREVAAAAIEQAFATGASVGAEVAKVRLRRGRGRTKDDDGTFDFNRVNEAAAAWARTQAGENIDGVTDETLAGIRAVLGDAFDAGWSSQKTARAIRSSIGLTERQSSAVVAFAERLADLDPPLSDEKLWGRVDRYADAQQAARALTIARTELAQAATQGQLHLWKQAAADGLIRGGAMRKVWLTAGDERMCDECESLGEEDPVGIDEAFSTGDDGPPAHPNCRCAVSLVRAEGEAGDDADAEDGQAALVAYQVKQSRDLSASVAAAVRDGLSSLSAAIAGAKPPVVNVSVAERPVHVDVNIPHRGPVTRRMEYDEHGAVTRVVEEQP